MGKASGDIKPEPSQSFERLKKFKWQQKLCNKGIKRNIVLSVTKFKENAIMRNEKIKKLFKSNAAKGVAVACVALMIGLAVYLNYRWFYDPTSSLGYGEGNMENNFSDSQSTGGSADASGNYFTSTALDRKEARDEAIDVLKLVTESEDATEQAKADASAKISQIAQDIQNEANIETLVKAKGFEECAAVISEGSVSVIVSAEALQAAESAQILTIVYETTGISPDKVSIINKA